MIDKKQIAQMIISSIFNSTGNHYIIHYSCSDLHQNPGLMRAHINSIVLKDFQTGSEFVFDLVNISKSMNVVLSIQNEIDVEKELLKRYNDFIKTHKNSFFVHWQMRNTSFGFQAIENRIQHLLCIVPEIIDKDKKIDLMRVLYDIYGDGFSVHPIMIDMAKLNNLYDHRFLTGDIEAKEFFNQNYSAVTRSTIRKVSIFSEFVRLIYKNKLKTRLSWWQKNSHLFKPLFILSLMGNFASIAGFIYIFL